jgi:hypothetical protein
MSSKGRGTVPGEVAFRFLENVWKSNFWRFAFWTKQVCFQAIFDCGQVEKQ